MVYPFNNGLQNASNTPKSLDNTYISMDIAIHDSSSSQVNSEGFQKQVGNFIEIFLPIETVSEANGGVKKVITRNGKKCYKNEHFHEKARRHRLQKGTVHLFLRPLRSELSLPCVITLTRYSPRKLDKFDNLPMSLKYILDAICEILTGDYRPGRADDSIEDEINVIYKQVLSEECGVKIRIGKE